MLQSHVTIAKLTVLSGFFLLSLLLEEPGGFVKLSALFSVWKENTKKEVFVPLGCRKEFVTPNTAVAQKLGDKTKIPVYIVIFKSLFCISVVTFFSFSQSFWKSVCLAKLWLTRSYQKNPRPTPKNKTLQKVLWNPQLLTVWFIGIIPCSLVLLNFFLPFR